MMQTGNEWRFMIVGGAYNGRERVFPCDAPVVVGRSHTANVQLPKSDADVSGRHAELLVLDGVAQVRNLSQKRPLRVNGAEVPSGGCSPVRAGDCVELGARVRIRLDAVPQPAGAPSAPDAATADGVTEETRFLAGEGATDVPTAVVEESATNATHVPDGATSATYVPESLLAGEPETETDGGDSQDGETVAVETRAGSWEEFVAMKEALDGKRRRRRVAVMLSFVLIAAALVAVYFITGSRDVESGMSWPKGADGKYDTRSYTIRGRNGNGTNGVPLIKVDYPGNPKITETPSADNTGVSVVTWYGKSRDVPYCLMFEATSHPDELHIDLVASVRRWFAKAEASGEGFVFDERMRDELAPRFFEDAYPGSCEEKTLYGVRFIEFEYKRTWPDGKLWHGWAHYFRSGDTVYLLRREIPEFYWARGGYRIKIDPNIAIYKTFSDAYWESPGDAKMPTRESTAELMSRIRDALAKVRAGDWRFVRRDIDTVLARTWRTDQKTRELAESCLRQYREALHVYYNGKYNAFLTAKDNRDEKKMQRIRLDAQSVFSESDERYYFLVNDGEVW